MSEEKSEKVWTYGDVAYMRAGVVSVSNGGRVLVGVRTDTGPPWAGPPGFVDVSAEPGALIDPDAFAAEMVRPVAMERDELREERNRLRLDVERFTKERDALRAELTKTRDGLQRTAAAMWEPLRGVAAALGYPRAAAPDFGEVDEAAVREWAEVLKERRVAQQTASRELADVLRERCGGEVMTSEVDRLRAEVSELRAEVRAMRNVAEAERLEAHRLTKEVADLRERTGRFLSALAGTTGELRSMCARLGDYLESQSDHFNG